MFYVGSTAQKFYKMKKTIYNTNSLQHKQSQGRIRKNTSPVIVYNILDFPTRKQHGR